MSDAPETIWVFQDSSMENNGLFLGYFLGTEQAGTGEIGFGPYTRTEQWNTDMDAAKGEGVVLIEAYVDCKRRVSTGGWDDHWTSERWVYDSNRIPIGTIPTRWMNLPPE